MVSKNKIDKQWFITIQGEALSHMPDDIWIMECTLLNRELLVDNAQLIIDKGPRLNVTAWLIHWIKDLTNHLGGGTLQIEIKMVMVPTLNDLFDPMRIHGIYKAGKHKAVSGTLGLSQDGRNKIGDRILYNWLVTSMQSFNVDGNRNDFIYMEVTATLI